jgi:hypothetical protein
MNFSKIFFFRENIKWEEPQKHRGLSYFQRKASHCRYLYRTYDGNITKLRGYPEGIYY